ncbi:MAG: DUF2795 domain-containing protein [Candidatus Doudnabacteria bacterium]
MASIIAKVSKSLKGIDFPADRKKVVEQAKHNSAPNDVIDVLNHIPDKEYDSMAGVWHAVGQMK